MAKKHKVESAKTASATSQMPNHLYYGDNLDVLREHVKTESVDLLYLDPPFNSQANYNVLFRAPSGEQSPAQIQAFEDTWGWKSSKAEDAFDQAMTSGHCRSRYAASNSWLSQRK